MARAMDTPWVESTWTPVGRMSDLAAVTAAGVIDLTAAGSQPAEPQPAVGEVLERLAAVCRERDTVHAVLRMQGRPGLPDAEKRAADRRQAALGGEAAEMVARWRWERQGRPGRDPAADAAEAFIRQTRPRGGVR